jgi:transposase
MLSDVGTIIDLSDDEWDFVADLFDPDGRRGTPAQHPRRRMVEAMLYLARTGCQWRYLPERFPAWEAVWSQWRRWRANGVWAAAMGRLARTIRADKRRYPEPSMVMLDAQTVRGGRAGPDVPCRWRAGWPDVRCQAEHPGRDPGPAARGAGRPGPTPRRGGWTRTARRPAA